MFCVLMLGRQDIKINKTKELEKIKQPYSYVPKTRDIYGKSTRFSRLDEQAELPKWP